MKKRSETENSPFSWLENGKIQFEKDEEELDSLNKSEWIIGVDFKGNTFVVKPPNIHDYILEYANILDYILECDNAEEIGLPYSFPDKDPGLYKVVCDFVSYTDWETNTVDDWAFKVKTMEKL